MSTSEIRQSLLNILISFDKFCNQNNLTMYLCAGTLLGAVRHHGFIPWDDDIDVCMSRPDYDRLIELTKNNSFISNKLEVVSFENKLSNYPYVKVIDKTTYIEQKYINEKNKSLWIDVFPIDGVSENTDIRKKEYSKISILRKIIILNSAKIGSGVTKIKKIIKSILIPISKLIGTNYPNFMINKLCHKYPFQTSSLVGDKCAGTYNSEIMKKKDFLKTDTVIFEGHPFKTMACYKQYLTDLYGCNYIKLPPKSQRKTHSLIAYKK